MLESFGKESPASRVVGNGPLTGSFLIVEAIGEFGVIIAATVTAADEDDDCFVFLLVLFPRPHAFFGVDVVCPLVFFATILLDVGLATVVQDNVVPLMLILFNDEFVELGEHWTESGGERGG